MADPPASMRRAPTPARRSAGRIPPRGRCRVCKAFYTRPARGGEPAADPAPRAVLAGRFPALAARWASRPSSPGRAGDEPVAFRPLPRPRRAGMMLPPAATRPAGRHMSAETRQPAGPAPTGGGSVLDRWFQIHARGSTVSAEVRGGVTTFVVMSYILAVNPVILSTLTQGKGPDFVAT